MNKFLKLKEYKPKYKMLEAVIPSELVIKLMPEEAAKTQYGDYALRSVMDFDSTQTTSVIIKKVKE